MYLTQGDRPLPLDIRNKASETPIMMACQRRAIKSLKLMLQMESSRNIVNAVDSKGMTALIFASQIGFYEAVELLLDKGAMVDLEAETGETGLIGASKNGHHTIVQLLLAEELTKRSETRN